MKILAERGYLIPAINTDTVDYVACATQLADSIRAWHPDANITVLTKEMLPYGDQGGFANDWQVFAASPYRQTIKLEADMIAASPVDHLWTMFEHRDVVISQGCRDFYDRPSTYRFYRKLFDANKLPDVYNAITTANKIQNFCKITGQLPWPIKRINPRGERRRDQFAKIIHPLKAGIVGWKQQGIHDPPS